MGGIINVKGKLDNLCDKIKIPLETSYFGPQFPGSMVNLSSY
jgi:hypothetical protein